MNAILRAAAASLALVATAAAAPASRLGSEILLQREDGNGFALIDRATGALRSGTVTGSGLIAWQHVVDTGMADVSDVAGGLRTDSGELLAVTTPLANRVALVEIDAGFPALTRFVPRNIGPRAVAEIRSLGGPEMLLSCTLNGTGIDDALEVHSDPIDGGSVLANDVGFGPVPRLEPLYADPGGTRIAVYARPSSSDTEVGICLRDATMLVPRAMVGGDWPEFITNVRADGGELLVVLYQPGNTRGMLLETILPIGPATRFKAPLEIEFPFPVHSVVPVAEGDPNMPDGMLVSSADGARFAWCRLSAAGEVNLQKELNDDPAGRFLGGLLVPGTGLLRFEGDDPDRPITIATAYRWNNGWQISDRSAVPAPADVLNRSATLFYFDQEPFTDEHARLLSIESAPDWTRKSAPSAVPPDVLRETFGGPETGLAAPSSIPTHPPSGAAYLLTNQVAGNLSLTAVEPASTLFEPGLRIEPESGSYPTTVTVTASYDDRLFRLYFRDADPSGQWRQWPGSLQVAHPGDYLFVLVHQSGPTATGAIIERSYQIDPAGIATADNDDDGVPDYVEQWLGTDPTGGADSDGDGVSDLEEALAGTNPADPASLPPSRDPVPQGDGFELAALPFSVAGDPAADGAGVFARSLTGALLGRAEVALIPASELPGIGRAAWISAATAVSRDELVTLSTSDFFAADQGGSTVDEGRELRAMIPVPEPAVATIAFTPSGTDLAADAAGWLAAAQAAYTSYVPIEIRTNLAPEDTAVAVLVEAMAHGAAVDLGLLAGTVTLAGFSAFPDRGQDADRVPLDQSLVNGLIGAGVDLRGLLDLATAAVTGADAGAAAIRATANGIYAHHVTNFDSDRGLDLPLDVLRVVLSGGPLPTNYSGATAPGDLAAAQATAAAVVGDWPSTLRPQAVWLVEIPASSPAPGVYALQPGGQEVELFDGGGRVFRLEQERALVPGSQFQVSGFADVTTASGRPGMEVRQVTVGLLPTSSSRDLDGNLLDDEWERFFFGAIGQNPQQIPPGSSYSLVQHLLEGTDPRSNGADEPGVPVVIIAPGPVQIAANGDGFDLWFQFPSAYLRDFTFRVESSETLLAGDFHELSGPVSVEDPPGSGQVRISVPPNPSPRCFYRVSVALR